jgi:prephenate dehydrogenase
MYIKPKNVVIIGAGQMAYHLGNALKRSNNKLPKVVKRGVMNQMKNSQA